MPITKTPPPLLASADKSSADRVSYTLTSEKVRVDRRPRAAETHGKRLELIERVKGHGWANLPSDAEIGRKLFAEYPNEWDSADAARVEYGRAKRAAGAEHLNTSP